MIKHRILLALFAVAALPSLAQAQSLELKKGDHISVIGNTLADRAQHSGWLESLILKANPDLDLTVRNLGFAADELTVRPRSADVPPTEEWLAKEKTDVVLAYYGFNESFKGEAGLAQFKTDLDTFIKTTLKAQYNGSSTPRLIIFSPIAQENMNDPNFSDPTANNKNIALYTAAMAEVSKANGVPFVDLFAASQSLYGKSSATLTHNGLHLTEDGYKALAPLEYKGLFAKDAPSTDDPQVAKIRAAVVDRNIEWRHIYRSVDQFNIWGDRSRIPYKNANDPSFPGVTNHTTIMEEFAQREVMVANRDKHIHDVAKGIDSKVEDTNLPKVTPVPANKGDVKPYLDPQEAIKTLKVPEGCKIELVASEKDFPELINPVQMNWDTKGRLWVAAWPNYPETKPDCKDFDKLLVFDIDPKTGKAIKCTHFLENLNCPTGFQFYKDGVLVMRSPCLEYWRDTDGDGKADTVERLLDGLDAADSHHETNSMCLEPGGATYCSDGVFHRTNIETAVGPVRNVNGAIYRFEPRSGKFERYIPYGFANPHGRVFDYWGNDIITDAPGNANYFGPGFSGFLSEGSHPGYQQFWNRPSRPCPGTTILSSRHFPDDWQGQFLNLNVISFQGIFRAKITEDGSSLHGETIEPMLEADITQNPNFRPSGASVAPDGSLYVMDWSQQLIGHLQHHLRDPNRGHEHGRIYRITYPSRPLLTPKKIDGEPIEALLDLLKEHEDNVRMRAKLELGKRDSKQVVTAVSAWVAKLDKSEPTYEHNVLEGLWVHQWHNIVDTALLEQVLKSKDARARAQGVRVLCYWRDRVPNALALLGTAIADESPRVRLETVRALSFFNGADVPKAIDIAYQVMKKPTDYTIEYCFKETMKQLQSLSKEKTLPADPELLATLISKMDDKELDSQPSVEAVLKAKLERRSYDVVKRTSVINDLAKLHKTDKLTELVAAYEAFDASGNAAASNELTKVLVSASQSELTKGRAALVALAAKAKHGEGRKAAWAGILIADGKADAAWEAASAAKATEALIQAIAVVPNPALRAEFQPKLTAALADAKGGTLKAILTALPLMGQANAAANFAVLAKNLIAGKERNTAVDSIRQLPHESWDKAQAGAIAESLLAFAKTVPTNKRTEQSFVELNQLAIDMAGLADNAALRKELRGLGVAVFVVKTVREGLKYDTTRLVVEKGKPFQIIFENSDVMPHNLLIVGEGKAVEIGVATMTMGPNDKDKQGRQYVPKNYKLIEGTKLLEPGQKQTLEVKAPNKEGSLDFVCTFPGHFMTMHGTIVVAKDVDAYLATNPNAPALQVLMPPAPK